MRQAASGFKNGVAMCSSAPAGASSHSWTTIIPNCSREPSIAAPSSSCLSCSCRRVTPASSLCCLPDMPCRWCSIPTKAFASSVRQQLLAPATACCRQIQLPLCAWPLSGSPPACGLCAAGRLPHAHHTQLPKAHLTHESVTAVANPLLQLRDLHVTNSHGLLGRCSVSKPR